MNNNLKIVGIALVAALVVSSGYSYFNPTTKETVRETIKEISKEEPVGAIPGNEVNSPFFGLDGANIYYKAVGVAQATSTVCAIPGPTASSTLAAVEVYVASSTGASSAAVAAARIQVYKAVTAFATTAAGQISQIHYDDSGLAQTGVYRIVFEDQVSTSSSANNLHEPQFNNSRQLLQSWSGSTTFALVEFTGFSTKGETSLFRGTGQCVGYWKTPFGN